MDGKERDRLAARIARELDGAVFPDAAAAASDIANLYGENVAAILFYGSCLREGSAEDKILDYYVLIDDPYAASSSRLLGFLNVLLPPNVFYRETQADGSTVRSKYGVVSLSGFCRSMSGGRFGTTFWARFSQPCRLVYARDEQAKVQVAEALAEALVTLARLTFPMIRSGVGEGLSPQGLFVRGYQLTYGAELRSEGALDAAQKVFESSRDFFEDVCGDALILAGYGASTPTPSRLRVMRAKTGWSLRALYGKFLSFARLIKGAATFSGGMDYLAWKIRRHSGVEIEVTDWQRRHPILAGFGLFIRLRRKGAFR